MSPYKTERPWFDGVPMSPSEAPNCNQRRVDRKRSIQSSASRQTPLEWVEGFIAGGSDHSLVEWTERSRHVGRVKPPAHAKFSICSLIFRDVFVLPFCQYFHHL